MMHKSESTTSLGDTGSIEEGVSKIRASDTQEKVIVPSKTPPPIARKPPVPVKQLPKVVAVFPFDGVESGDLPFKKDDIIEVIEKEGDWWKGQLNGKKGVFPSNYVKPFGE